MALWDPRAAGAPAEGRWGFYDSVNKPGGQREARVGKCVFLINTHTNIRGPGHAPFPVACFHSALRHGRQSCLRINSRLGLYLPLASLSRLLPICVYNTARYSHNHNCVNLLLKSFRGIFLPYMRKTKEEGGGGRFPAQRRGRGLHPSRLGQTTEKHL